jgi:hypothetical protein
VKPEGTTHLKAEVILMKANCEGIVGKCAVEMGSSGHYRIGGISGGCSSCVTGTQVKRASKPTRWIDKGTVVENSFPCITGGVVGVSIKRVVDQEGSLRFS